MPAPRCMHCRKREDQHDDRRCGGEFVPSELDEFYDVLQELYDVMDYEDILDDAYEDDFIWGEDLYDRGELDRGDIVVA